MASEEERAAILAEYKASLASGNNDDDDDFDDEDEADFDPDDDEGEYNDDDDDEDEEEAGEPDCVVLTGSIHLNDEGRIIYSGTWCMKSELLLGNDNNGEQHKKHHPRFKLKSQDVCYPPNHDNGVGGSDGGSSGTKKLFDIRHPTLTKLPTDDNGENKMELPSRRIMIFDGFFFAKNEEAAPILLESGGGGGEKSSGPKKIKERDVELFISVVEDDDNDDDNDNDDAEKKKSKTVTTMYRIAGRGENEYGQFVLDGSYTPPPPATKKKADEKDVGKEGGSDNGHHHHHHHHKHKGEMATVICNKTYGVGGSAKETRAAKGSTTSGDGGRKRKVIKDDDSFDEYFDTEERADYTELTGLYDDANLTVEELRKKYYGGDGAEEDDEVDADDDGGGKMAAVEVTKKPRLDNEEKDGGGGEESDDEECGF